MTSGRRKFRKPPGSLRYRKLFVIATEGIKTEPMYFNMFGTQEVLIHCLKNKLGNAPLQLLKNMHNHLKKMDLGAFDEAWIVVDKDQWTDEQLRSLHLWSQEQANYGFALSNPKFEYWLLLHFEDGAGINSPQDCSDRLKHHLPDYDKDINARKITPERVNGAIRRARQRDNPPCSDWPRASGVTTVYRLIQNILQAIHDSKTRSS